MQAELRMTSPEVVGEGAWPVLSLFSGAGGLDLGFKHGGFRPGLAVDIDPAAIETYSWNQPDTHVAQLDISQSDPNDLVDLWISENGDEAPAGVIGGPPCQAFSASNVHQKRRDPRRKLLISYANVLEAFNRRLGLDFFVFENVLGLTQGRHRWRYLQFKRMCKAAGFVVREKVVNAGRFGIPQNRKRIIVIGINRERFPLVVLDPPEGDIQPLPARVALGGLPEPAFCQRDSRSSQSPPSPKPCSHGSQVQKVHQRHARARRPPGEEFQGFKLGPAQLYSGLRPPRGACTSEDAPAPFNLRGDAPPRVSPFL